MKYRKYVIVLIILSLLTIIYLRWQGQRKKDIIESNMSKYLTGYLELDNSFYRLNSLLDIYLKVEDKGEDFLLLFDAAIMNEMSVINKIESDIHSNLLLLPSEIAVNEFSYSGYPLMPVIRDALNNKDNFEDIKRILSSLSIEDLGDITQEDKRLALNNKLRQIKADLAELP